MATDQVDLQRADEISWYHTLELAPGHVTRGMFDLRPHVHEYGLPERLDGKRLTKTINVQPGERVSLDVKPERPAPTPEPAHRGPQWALGWIFLGVGGAAGSAASFIGWQGLVARDTWVDSNFGDTSARDRALSFRTAANGLWIGAAALSITGAVLVITAP